MGRIQRITHQEAKVVDEPARERRSQRAWARNAEHVCFGIELVREVLAPVVEDRLDHCHDDGVGQRGRHWPTVPSAF